MKREHFFNFSPEQRDAICKALESGANAGYCPTSAADLIPRLRSGARDFFAGEIAFALNVLSQYGDAVLADRLAGEPEIETALRENFRLSYPVAQSDQEPSPPGGAQ